MTTLEELKQVREEVFRLNDLLYQSRNENDFLYQKVSELIALEWELRFKCAQEGIDHTQVK